jgi:hypothetical protein
MFRTPQSVLKHRPLEDSGGDGGSQYDDIRTSTKKQKIIETGTETAKAKTSNNNDNCDVSVDDSMYIEDDFARNRSNETYSTANSSGIYSLELLKEIYPALSETDSEGGAQEEEQDYDELDTVIHMNHHSKDDGDSSSLKAGVKLAKDDGDDNDKKDFSMSTLVYSKVLTTNQINRMSSWDEDRPFDEESLRALSEKQMSENGGDYCVETIYAKKFSSPVKEYILPPFDGTCDGDDDDDSIPPPAPPPPALMKNTMHVPAVYSSSHDGFLRSSDDEESITSSTRAIDEDNKRGMRQKKYWLILFILITLLLAAALLIGFTVSRNRNNSDKSNISSIDSNESSAQLNDADADAGETSTTTTASSTSDTSLTEDPVAPPTEPSQEQDSALVPSSDNIFTPPPPRPWGNIIGYTDPIPRSYFPLGFCEGDCDRNSDCADGLVCVQRRPNDPVPFCHGGENDTTRTDYCTYASQDDFESASGSEESPTEECISTITVTQDCYFRTENVIVINFVNCDPSNSDWIGIYADGTAVEDANSVEWLSDDYIDWAFSCGEQDCNDSPSTYSFAFSTNGNSAYDFLSLRAYLISYTTDTRPPYEVIAKTEPFIPTQVCQ